ncbi:hypothetical protein Bca101_040040 [Brassica carinata]
MAETRVEFPDPETEFFASKQETGHEWELFNHALKSHSDHQSRKTLVEKRRKLIEEIDEYEGDDPLFPWIKCVKWVHEAFPPGGECSGLLVIYEQCVRKFWHSDRYKDDLRYLKGWLEYAEHCVDAEVIYEFLEVNDIGRTHGLYYIDYALHMECKGKVKTANEIFNLGISRYNAKPVEKLNDAYKKFMVRTIRRSKSVDDEPKENDLPSRSFGTVLSRGIIIVNTGRQALGPQAKRTKLNHSSKAPLAVYKDTTSGDQTESDKSKPEFGPWLMLEGRGERTKRTMLYLENEHHSSQGVEKKKSETISSSSNILPLNDSCEIKKETELLRQNPLRHFPSSSFLR